MKLRKTLTVLFLIVLSASFTPASFLLEAAKGKNIRLKGLYDGKAEYKWASECKFPDGKGLAFGGSNGPSDDGRPHTRLLKNGAWVSIKDKLRKKNPLQKHYDTAWKLRIKPLRGRFPSSFLMSGGAVLQLGKREYCTLRQK